MSRANRVVQCVVGIAAFVGAASAIAQSNLDAGKSPAQIFSDTCNACHRGPRELKQTSSGFLRQHYTTGGKEAAAMAAYLASVGSDPRAVQQRRPPALEVGRAAATDTATRPQQTVPGADQTGPLESPPARRPPPIVDQAKLSQNHAAGARSRRPSDSVEAGNAPPALAEGANAEIAPPTVGALPPAGQDPRADFEE